MKKQQGQILIMVLVLMALGALMLAPTLALASTVLIATRRNSVERSKLFYAADSGIELGMWHLTKENCDSTYYTELNGCDVTVEVHPVFNTIGKEFLGQIVGEKVKNAPHFGESGFEIQKVVENSTATITVLNNREGKTNNIQELGIWIHDFITFKAGILNVSSIPDRIITSLGGTSFIWDKQNLIGINDIKIGESKSYSFSFEPNNTSVAIAWIRQSSDIWVNASLGWGEQPDIEELGIYKILSTAFNNNKRAFVESYVLKAGNRVQVLNWEQK